MISRFLFLNSLALSSGKGRNLFSVYGFANEVSRRRSANDKVVEGVTDKKVETSSAVKVENKVDNVDIKLSSNINKTI